MNNNRRKRIESYASSKIIATTHNGKEVRVTDTVKAFNATEWQKTGDIGDNSQFFQLAEIISLRTYESPFGGTNYVADIKWKHNGEVSNGHFVRDLVKC